MSNTNAKKHAATGGGPPEKKRKLNSSDLILQTIASLNNPSLPIPSPPPITTIRKAVTKNPYLLPPDERSQLQISEKRIRKLKFNQQGKFVNEGNVLRKQAQLEQLRAKIDEEMRKKGIESAIVSDVISKKDPLPVLDWWHLPFVKNIETFSNVVAASKYDPVETSSAVKSLLNLDNVSRAIIHPVPFFGRVKGPEAPTVKPLVLTEAEQKKLRRQRRLEEQKLKREKINLGLLPKEETKLKLSNYMAVMGNEALSDPTKAEAVVRAQIQARQEAHLAANSSRQLSKEERAEKERLKLAREFYHPKDGFLQVLAFRLLRLDIPKWKFKIKANASQLHIFGCMIQHRQQNLVIVEGSSRSIRKFHHLMTSRIKWNDDIAENNTEDAFSIVGNAAEEPICRLVWKGTTPRTHFTRFESIEVEAEIKAMDYLKEVHLEYLWSYSKSVDSITDAYFGDITEVNQDSHDEQLDSLEQQSVDCNFK